MEIVSIRFYEPTDLVYLKGIGAPGADVDNTSDLLRSQFNLSWGDWTVGERTLDPDKNAYYYELTPKDRFFNIYGIDDVCFMFSANPGQPPMELASIASGGEASRIMLAIKTVLSAADTMPTMIFDEIDTGVSGRASLSIARKLKSISKEHQVLCVSHTAQLAAASDSNFLIEKNTDGNNTFTEITLLDEEGRVREVSRLLSGKDDIESNELSRKMIAEFRT